MSALQWLVAGSTLHLPLLHLCGPASPPLTPPTSLAQHATPTPAKIGSTGSLDLSPFSFASPIALLFTPLAWSALPIPPPHHLPHHSNAPLFFPPASSQPRLTQELCAPRVPVPHPAITAPMKYNSNRQKVPRFCGAMVSWCQPLCRPLPHTLLTTSASAASARQPTRP